MLEPTITWGYVRASRRSAQPGRQPTGTIPGRRRGVLIDEARAAATFRAFGRRTAGRYGEPVESHSAASAGGGERPRMDSRLKAALIALAVLLVVCLGAATAYFVYDRATEPDRNSPSVVLYQYLNVRFGERDPARAASLYECKRPRLAELNALANDLLAREQAFNVQINVEMTNSRTQFTAASATMDADLLLWVRQGTGRNQDVQPWRFDFVDERGWRLCSANRR